MDSNHYIPARRLWPALVALLMAGDANASAITNLTGKPYVFEIQSPEGFVAREIPTGSIARFYGRMKIRVGTREITLDQDTEYAVWPDGSFGPQRKRYEHQRR